MFLFYVLVLIGLALIVGSIVAIVKTDWGFTPALVGVAGIFLAFFLPEMFFGPSGIYISPLQQFWLDFHHTLGHIAFVAMIITIIVDGIFVMRGSPLWQRNQIKDASVATDADWIKKENGKEFWGLVIALAATVGMYVGFNYYHGQTHPLTEVGQVATERGFPVMLNPFIVEVPGEEFPGIDDLKQKAVRHAAANGLVDLEIDHVYSLRFIARDSDHINEIVLVFDGTFSDPGSKGRKKIAANPTKGIRGFAEVPKDRSPLDRRAIAVKQSETDTVTQEYADALVEQLNRTVPINGSGFSFVGNSRPVFPPSPLGGNPLRSN